MGTKQIDAFAAHAKDADWIKDGLRPYFRYRDLGIKNATQGRVLAQVIKAAEPCKGAMGYHSHVLEFQMAYMLKGWARMYFEGWARCAWRRATPGTSLPASSTRCWNTRTTGR